MARVSKRDGARPASNTAIDAAGDPKSSATGDPGDDAKEALLEAAIDLLATHGPDGFSSREVAKAAGVNYGLIHYYFGNRNELLRQAISREIDGWGANNPSVDDTAWTPLLLGDPPPERAWRSLVHLALSWDRYADVVDDFPLMRHRLQIHKAQFGDDVDETQLKAALVASTCLQMGWLAVSNWYLASVDATDQERRSIESFVVDVERSILELALAGSEPTTDALSPAD